MAYALVHDVPASWERYDPVARLLRHAPRGLLVHVAGPTDEGFRIVEIWASEAAWQAFEPDFASALGSIDPTVGPKTVVRDLFATHEVLGVPGLTPGQQTWIAAGHDQTEPLTPAVPGHDS